jgi:hypothetical protein
MLIDFVGITELLSEIELGDHEPRRPFAQLTPSYVNLLPAPFC